MTPTEDRINDHLDRNAGRYATACRVVFVVVFVAALRHYGIGAAVLVTTALALGRLAPVFEDER